MLTIAEVIDFLEEFAPLQSGRRVGQRRPAARATAPGQSSGS